MACPHWKSEVCKNEDPTYISSANSSLFDDLKLSTTKCKQQLLKLPRERRFLLLNFVIDGSDTILKSAVLCQLAFFQSDNQGDFIMPVFIIFCASVLFAFFANAVLMRSMRDGLSARCGVQSILGSADSSGADARLEHDQQLHSVEHLKIRTLQALLADLPWFSLNMCRLAFTKNQSDDFGQEKLLSLLSISMAGFGLLGMKGAMVMEFLKVFFLTPVPEKFPWASSSDVDEIRRCGVNCGKRVGIGDFEVNLAGKLGEGQSGFAFLVTVLMPQSRAGETAVLKVEQAKPIWSIAREVAIMKKAKGVPHSSQFMAFGRIWIPSSMFGKKWPDYFNTEALLMTAAAGEDLQKLMPLDAEASGKIKADLQTFANAMYERNLFHGDLTLANVLWDGSHATVIDFGNGQDLGEKPLRRQDSGARLKFKDAKHEMWKFFRSKLDSQ